MLKGKLDKSIPTVVAVILAALPFITPIIILLGSHLNQLNIFKVWKEIAMVLIGVLILTIGTHKRLGAIKDVGIRLLAWLIFAYAAWTIVVGLINILFFDQINWEAFIYALIVNLRFPFFLILCWLVAGGHSALQNIWGKLVLIPAAVVVIFGLLQLFILPANVLEHFGYGVDSITAYQTVDNNPNYVRIQSTLRGPNPLGAYLIIVIITALMTLRGLEWKRLGLLIGASIVLFHTYSRSAWLGLVVSLGTLAYISIGGFRLRHRLAILGAIGLLVFGGLIYVARDNQFVQKTIFHTDETSQSPQSTNEQRAGAIERGAHDVLHEPFGRGPGSAGPASLRNSHPERIAENYYLQIGQEVGWVGLLLFIAINIQTARLLWQRRSSALAKILLASLAGITVISMLSHAWTDETLSLLWWGLAGIALIHALKPTKAIPTKVR